MSECVSCGIESQCENLRGIEDFEVCCECSNTECNYCYKTKVNLNMQKVYPRSNPTFNPTLRDIWSTVYLDEFKGLLKTEIEELKEIVGELV